MEGKTNKNTQTVCQTKMLHFLCAKLDLTIHTLGQTVTVDVCFVLSCQRIRACFPFLVACLFCVVTLTEKYDEIKEKNKSLSKH